MIYFSKNRDKSLNKKYYNNPYFLFSCTYGLFAILLVLYIWFSGRIAIGGTDGVCQHYVAMEYISKFIRSVISGFFHGDFQIPMYDLSIGMGDDILDTLNFYGLGDPFYLFTALVPVSVLPFFFTFLFYFRLYLSGLCTILFLRKLLPHKNTWSYILAATLFCCSGFAFESNVHIIFVHALMYLPLVLWAIESRLSNDQSSSLWLILSLCCLAMTGIFYLFIISVTVAIYAIYRWSTFYRKQGTPFTALVYTGLICIAGISLSSFILLPEIYAFSVDSRNISTGSTTLSLFFDWSEIKYQYYRFFYVSDIVIGKASIAVPGLLSMLIVLSSKSHKQSKLFIVLGILSYNSPVIRWIMSGMRDSSYNRWEIVLALLFSSMTVIAWDDLWSLSKFQIFTVIMGFVIMIAIGFFDGTLLERCYRNSLLAYALCLCVIIVLRSRLIFKERFLSICLISVFFVCTMLTWCTNMINYPISSLYLGDKSELIFSLKHDSDFFRLEDSDAILIRNLVVNNSMHEGYSTTTEYFSIDNPQYRSARDAWNLGDSYYIIGLDNRTILENMSCSKYIIVSDDEETLVPYGYELSSSAVSKEDAAKNLYLYNNKNVLPLMYIYDNVTDHECYQKLDPIRRQISMLDYIALEGYAGESSQSLIETEVKTIGCKIESEIQYTIDCFCPAGYESYLVLNINNSASVDSVVVDNIPKKFFNFAIRYINLGYHETDTYITVKLNCDTPLTESNVSVQGIDMSILGPKLNTLANSGVSDTNIGTNSITAQCSRTHDGWLCLSVPHTNGWKAYVDGIETDIYTANDLFMGIYVSEGNHTIEFKYVTPGIREGSLISLFTLICIISISLFMKKRSIQSFNNE